MKKIFTSRLILLTLFFAIVALQGWCQVAGDFQTKVSGNWSDFNSWNIRNATNTAWVAAVAGQIPTATTSVFVQTAHVISVDNGSAVCNDLNVNGSGTSKIAFSAANSILNVKGNMALFNTSHNCFGIWTVGAKIVFSGVGGQGFTNLSVSSVFINIEVNKLSGTLTTSSNLRFGSFALTAGNFIVGSGNEIQGSSGSATININGGVWTQVLTTTKIFSIPTASPLPIGAIKINGGSMILATTNGSPGFMFSTLSITNGGTLTLNNFPGGLTIGTSINVDVTSTINTALSTLTLPAIVTFNGVANYNHIAAQTINPATYSYLKLSGTGTKTLGGSVIIPANGTLEMSGVATSPTLALGSGSLTVSSIGTNLIYSSAGSQSATGIEWSSTFNNVTINNSTDVSMAAGLIRTILGSLNLTNGTLNIGSGGVLTLDGASVSRTNGYIAGTSTSDLAIIGTTGGTALLPISGNISLRNVTIGGNRTLQMNGTSNINLNGSFTIATDATYDNGGESQIIDGGGSISITGKFITRDVQGFFATNAAIPGIIPVLNPGCTIEYALLGDQAVQGSTVSYENVTFSGSGTKTLASATAPKGTVYITENAILQTGSHTFGDNGTAPLTNFTMDGGRLIMSGTNNPQPHMTGTYNLTGGVLEFACNSVSGQTIRNRTYYSIEVTGINVGNSSGNINLASGGSFTVKTGGKFNINADQITGSPGSQSVVVESGAEFQCGNADGFSGGNGSAGNSTSIKSDIETISLAAGSTVNYMRSGNQTITNQLPYTNLILSGTGIKTAPAGLLSLLGDLTKSGTSSFVNNNGTIVFSGLASQAYSATTPLTFYNLTNSNTIGLSVNSDLVIEREFTLSDNSKITLASGNITLKSTAANTANVAQVPLSALINYGSGMFVVERFISAKRAWRFLAVPASTTQTIQQAWQEGAASSASNPFPGFGTQVTNNTATWSSDGFDYYSPDGPSVKKWNSATNKYVGINSTSIGIAGSDGLMTFVRGDRTAIGLYATPTTTVFRTKGQLFTGDQSVITINAGEYTSVGNPYPASLDMRMISKTGGVDDLFIVYDPNVGALGTFQYFTKIGSDYYPSPGDGSYPSPSTPYNYIASGIAFFMYATASGGNVTIKENAKGSGDLPLVFRPANISEKFLRTNLYVLNDNGNTDLADGILNIFDDNYSNEIDGKDAKKLMNFSENLGIKVQDQLLAIERRHMVISTDTIFLSLGKMKTRSYQLKFTGENFNQPGLTGFLEDRCSNTSIPIDLNGSTLYNFKITNDSASWKQGRFRIILINAAAGPLPVTFSFVKGYEQNMNILVEWKIENEKNIKEYIVEESVDGQQFTPTTSIEAKGNNSNTVNYQWTDANPVSGNNYYRIRSVDINGQVQYSTIVKVTTGKVNPQMAIYPNPIANGIINLQLINQPKGKYYVRLLNSLGQVIFATQVLHEQGSSTRTIPINKTLGNGNYLLEVTGAGKNKTILKVSK